MNSIKQAEKHSEYQIVDST